MPWGCALIDAPKLLQSLEPTPDNAYEVQAQSSIFLMRYNAGEITIK